MKFTKGFTMVELLIAVMIVGILAAIAYPIYQEQVMKAGRTEAMAILNDVAQRMQRCYTVNGMYKLPDDPQCGVVTELETGSGIASETRLYNVTLSNHDTTTYTLTAAAESTLRQAGDMKCISFSLTHTGVRSAKKEGNADNTDLCWGR